MIIISIINDTHSSMGVLNALRVGGDSEDSFQKKKKRGNYYFLRTILFVGPVFL